MPDFKQKVKLRKDSYSGDVVKKWLEDAYELGINDFGEELKKRFEDEARLDKETRAGLFRALNILLEYGC